MKKSIIMVFSLLVLGGNMSGEEMVSPSFYDSQVSWTYTEVLYPFMEEAVCHPADITKIIVECVGTETRDGHTYDLFSWERQGDYGKDLKFLVRENDGAFYGYVVPKADENDSEDGGQQVKSGEYLLYDFNMEVGDQYVVPYLWYPEEKDEYALESFENRQMASVTVVGKRTTDDGRRVLDLDFNNSSGLYMGCSQVVEGVGPLSNGCLGFFYFRIQPAGSNYVEGPILRNVVDEEGETVYVHPDEVNAGMVKEMDYEYVYALRNADKTVTYYKMGFNHLATYDGRPYRRFTVLGVSDNPDAGWVLMPFQRYLVREEAGKVWLLHSDGLMNTSKSRVGKNDYEESMIYDFSAPEGSEVEIYTPSGSCLRTVRTTTRNIGGKETHAYYFEDNEDYVCVEGIGLLKGGIFPCVNLGEVEPGNSVEDNYANATLIAVYDGEGRLIFHHELSDDPIVSVQPIEGTTQQNGKIYDLMGRELEAPLMGQPFIHCGKIQVVK